MRDWRERAGPYSSSIIGPNFRHKGVNLLAGQSLVHLRRISAILHRDDPCLPDLADMERRIAVLNLRVL
jgi:hypothetical protein